MATLLWGRLAIADHITLGEGRTVIKLLELLTGDVRCHRRRVISLQDNRPISGSFSKGRSTSGPLSYICRQRTAFGVAAEVQLLLPWVQSKLMPADDLSRAIDEQLQHSSSDHAAAVSRLALRGRPQG